ncbi:MAG: hypothetical protein IKR21_06575 [Oscillospiraceae bacterium]|nr:hypothetical protein [Oscillospiraceae bacterium]
MRIKARDFIEKWREDYHFKTLSSSAFSALLGVAFMVTNGVLGIVYRSLWHGSIFVYYFLLTGI